MLHVSVSTFCMFCLYIVRGLFLYVYVIHGYLVYHVYSVCLFVSNNCSELLGNMLLLMFVLSVYGYAYCLRLLLMRMLMFVVILFDRLFMLFVVKNRCLCFCCKEPFGAPRRYGIIVVCLLSFVALFLYFVSLFSTTVRCSSDIYTYTYIYVYIYIYICCLCLFFVMLVDYVFRCAMFSTTCCCSSEISSSTVPAVTKRQRCTRGAAWPRPRMIIMTVVVVVVIIMIIYNQIIMIICKCTRGASCRARELSRDF